MIPDAAHWVTGGLIPGPSTGRPMGGIGGNEYVGAPLGTTGPSLAGANAGYNGAPQSNGSFTLSPYVQAARAATATRITPNTPAAGY